MQNAECRVQNAECRIKIYINLYNAFTLRGRWMRSRRMRCYLPNLSICILFLFLMNYFCKLLCFTDIFQFYYGCFASYTSSVTVTVTPSPQGEGLKMYNFTCTTRLSRGFMCPKQQAFSSGRTQINQHGVLIYQVIN